MRILIQTKGKETEKCLAHLFSLNYRFGNAYKATPAEYMVAYGNYGNFLFSLNKTSSLQGWENSWYWTEKELKTFMVFNSLQRFLISNYNSPVLIDK